MQKKKSIKILKQPCIYKMFGYLRLKGFCRFLINSPDSCTPQLKARIHVSFVFSRLFFRDFRALFLQKRTGLLLEPETEQEWGVTWERGSRFDSNQGHLLEVNLESGAASRRGYTGAPGCLFSAGCVFISNDEEAQVTHILPQLKTNTGTCGPRMTDLGVCLKTNHWCSFKE